MPQLLLPGIAPAAPPADPLTARGSLGLWEWDAPNDVLALLPKGGD